MRRPEIRFFVSGEAQQVSTDSPLWKLLLLGRDYPRENLPNQCPTDDTTIGEFLLCAEKFIRSDDFSLLKSAAGALLEPGSQLPEIKTIDLTLEKHGKFYHPIRIRVFLDPGLTCSLVLNGAVSGHGRDMAKKEYSLIKSLERVNDLWLPKVFGCRRVQVGNRKATFFLGQWLEGFHEFHLTRDRGKPEIVIWETGGQKSYEKIDAIYPAYGRMASILTECYNVDTFCQIYPWHHAAGDFIIKKDDGAYQPKLISVRGYENLTDFEREDEADKHFVLPALLFFFLNMTLRMRIDRLDGTGETALVDEGVIPFIIQGFFDGLERKHDPELKDAFIKFIKMLALDQILEIVENILDDFPPSPSEKDIVRKEIKAHFKKVKAFFETV